MNIFEEAIARYIGPDRLVKVQGVKVGIAGAGGLGSNCAFNLVRSGFNKLKIVDFDRVEPSNLDRQFYFADQIGLPKVEALKTNLLRINPGLQLEAVTEKIKDNNVRQMFDDCQVVVEAFDKAEFKAMLVESYYNSGKLLVAASGIAGWGNSDKVSIRKIHSRFYLVGDMKSEASGELPPISPKVNMAAAKQADVVLNWVLEELCI